VREEIEEAEDARKMDEDLVVLVVKARWRGIDGY
jgi:hypothetical protein